MPDANISRRTILKASGIAAASVFASPIRAAAPEPTAVTPALIEAARKAEESYAPCYYYAGYAAGKEGRMDDALKLFDEAKKLNPFDYNNFVYQGKVFEAQKDQKKAIDAYTKALKIILHLD
jgi:tetratricopeptide (TPR) repeat protein